MVTKVTCTCCWSWLWECIFRWLPSWSVTVVEDAIVNLFRWLPRWCVPFVEAAVWVVFSGGYLGDMYLLLKLLLGLFSGGYQGDVYLLLKLLLPGVVKTVYNLNNKQLVKLFSQVGNWKWSGAWVCSSPPLPWLWQLLAVSRPSRLHCSAPQCHCSSMAVQSRDSYMCWIASRNWIWGCTSGGV